MWCVKERRRERFGQWGVAHDSYLAPFFFLSLASYVAHDSNLAP